MFTRLAAMCWNITIWRSICPLTNHFMACNRSDWMATPPRSPASQRWRQHYLAELRQIQPTGPYYLGGRSFGGSVAYEMACQLHAQGEAVGLLAMLDTYPLGWLKLCTPEDATRYAKKFFRLRITRHLDNLRRLNLADKLQYIWGKAQYKKRKYKNWWWQFARNWQELRHIH